jgi:hypothetical protein
MNCSTTENEIIFCNTELHSDIGREEQVSGIVRIVSIHEAGTKVKENFL